MNNTFFTFPIKSDHIRKISDPFDGLETFYALCPVESVPDIPLENTNPREQNLKSPVARAIRRSLLQMDGRFHLLNRGITISVGSANYDNKSEKLRLEFFDDGVHGNIDGGHTQQIIRQLAGSPEWEETKQEKIANEEQLHQQYVRLEIITKLPPQMILDIAEARNTSVQVKEFSIDNLAGKFGWLKDQLKEYESAIVYKENEDKPVNVRDVIALLTLFNVELYPLDGNSYPLQAYSNKAKTLEWFCDQEKSYRKLRPILKDILQLYDYVRGRMKDVYNESGGKFAKWEVIEQRKTDFHFLKTQRQVNFRVPDGIVYPILGAFRFLLKETNGEVKWKVDDVRKFYDRFGARLIRIALETTRMLGYNPMAAGKNENLWAQLFNEVRLAYYELLDVDVNREVRVGKLK